MTVRFESNLPRVELALRRGFRRNLAAAIEVWHTQLMQTLQGPRSGRTYRIPGTGRTYTASAPGEPPAKRLGDLQASYGTEVREADALIGTRLNHGEYLERGTPTTKPRPALQPSMERARPAIVNEMTRRLF